MRINLNKCLDIFGIVYGALLTGMGIYYKNPLEAGTGAGLAAYCLNNYIRSSKEDRKMEMLEKELEEKKKSVATLEALFEGKKGRGRKA